MSVHPSGSHFGTNSKKLSCCAVRDDDLGVAACCANAATASVQRTDELLGSYTARAGVKASVAPPTGTPSVVAVYRSDPVPLFLQLSLLPA